jgi:hypothetical protein
MAKKQYPIRDERGAPVGSTPDASSATDVRFWVESSLREGEVVAVTAADGTFNLEIRELLCQLLDQARETNVHLRHLSGLSYDIHH